MGFGGGRKVSRRGLIIIAALMFGIALSARQSVHVPHQSADHPSGVLVMLSKKTQEKTNQNISAGTLSSMVSPGAGSNVSSRLQLTKGTAALFKGGTLAESETWTPEQTYVIDGRLVVPAGVTLTLQPGVMIKVMNEGEGIVVGAGGAVMIRGTSTNPITITSFHDPAGGSLDKAKDPSAGDYRSAIVIHEGAGVAASHLQIRYAETALMSAGMLAGTNVEVTSVRTALLTYQGDIRMTALTVTNALYGIVVEGGAAVLQGSLHNISQRPIQACNWENEACFVDATTLYVAGWEEGALPDWCGRVVTGGESFFASRNCDGSTLPADRLLSSSRDFADRLSVRTQTCNDGVAEACQMAQNATACLEGAVTAMSIVPFALPDINPASNAEHWGADLGYRANEHLSIQRATFSGSAERRADIAATIRALHMAASAYQSCAP